jgi:hypothetical protein
MRYGVFILAAALIAAPIASAYADVTITSEMTGANGVTEPHILYLTANEIKDDTPKVAIIFDVAAGKMGKIVKEKKEYREIDVKAFGARIIDATAMMKQKLQSVPEAQRKMIETMMAKHGGLPGAQKITTSYEKTGDSRTIGFWPCQMFHQKKDAKLIADLCIAKADAVGLTQDNQTELRALAESMTKLLPDGFPGNSSVIDFDEQTRQVGFVGIPVEAAFYLNGAVFSTTTIKSVDHATIAPDTFVIPAGYAKKALPGLTIGQ